MSSLFWETVYLTFKLATVTTVLLIIFGIPTAYFLSKSQSRWKPFFEALISMPIVLPPTVIGFYLLLLFSPETILGSWLQESLNIELAFTFTGLVIGSIIYSFPFMVNPIQSGLQNLPPNLAEASYTLGKGRFETLWKVLLPNIKPSILTGFILSFAHTIGEFGVVLMIGGNIPGQTRVASIAIYDEVESLNYSLANKYSLLLFLFSFVVLVFIYSYNRRLNTFSPK
ncbi:MAG: molybdate ABC transporter permease subunit [Bacteroidetes bacterium]|jgi:molybdate transport system permease protein|nr:molybdate ABC transporter permease subunit [Bacteroidota bacterium]MDF1864463.1 molybdate ABC transporter permease subunit [Saprospiraceae bacterium]